MSTVETAAPGPVHFTVIGQVPALVPTGTGSYIPGYRITAQLDSGTTFQVDVPDAGYNAANVQALLADKAAHADAINNLSG